MGASLPFSAFAAAARTLISPCAAASTPAGSLSALLAVAAGFAVAPVFWASLSLGWASTLGVATASLDPATDCRLRTAASLSKAPRKAQESIALRITLFPHHSFSGRHAD